MSRISVWLSAALIASCATASAQTRYVTVDVTGGTFNVDHSGLDPRASFDISGPGVHFVSDGIEPGVVYAAVTCKTFGCRPGDVLTLGANFSGSYLGHGIATVGEETLNPAHFAGAMVFTTDELMIPRGNRKYLVLSVPFTLSRSPTEPGATLGAWVTGLGRFMGGEEPWVVATLSGSGTATAFFRRDHYKGKTGLNEFVYDLVRIVYSFNTPPTTQ